MEEIKLQVSRARRRLIAQQFLGIIVWSLFATLLISAAAVAVTKIWVIPVDAGVWLWSWVGGSLTLGILTASLWTFCIRRKRLDAAIEIDRRFGLKERVSSTLSLAPADLETEAGQALMNDAIHRVKRIDIRDQFGVSMNWRVALPLLPAMFVFVLAFLVPDASNDETKASESRIAIKSQIKKSTDALKKKIAQQRSKAEQKGLKEAELIFKKLEDGLDKLNSKDKSDQKKALIKLNDLAKDLAKRRQQLGGSDKMKKRFDKLKDIKSGPADKMVKAMKQGNFQQAMNEMQKLKEKISKGELSDQEKKQLANQLDQMKKKIEEMVQAQEQAKKDLEEQIKQKMAAGDLAGAGKLQQKLDQLNQQDQAMQQMQKMANKMAQASDALKQGDSKSAAQQLDQLAKDLEQMQKDMDELESLDEVMDQIADAKNAMNCEECQGGG